MLDDPNASSTWLGRILVRYYLEDRKYPQLKVQSINTESEFMKKNFLTKHNKMFNIFCQFGESMHLPKNKNYKL